MTVNEARWADVERYLAGDMTPEDAAAFLQDVRRDPEAMAWLGRSLVQQADLFDAARSEVHLNESSKRASETARILKFRKSKGRRRHRESPGLWLAVGGAAAGIALVLGLVLASGGSPPVRTPPNPVAKESRPEPKMPAIDTAPRKPEPPPAAGAPPPGAKAPPTPGRPGKPPRDAAPPPTPAPRPASAPPARRPVPRPVPPSGKTEAAVAVLDEVVGTVEMMGVKQARVAQAQDTLRSGAGIRTVGEGSRAILRVAVGARVSLTGNTSLPKILPVEKGWEIHLSQGEITAQVDKQRSGSRIVFVTPQAEAVVLGTRLKLSVRGGISRLEVTEGRVRLRRRSDGTAADVRAGFFAEAGAAAKPSPVKLPINEIVLRPKQGTLSGRDWRVVRDPDASTGLALEAFRLFRGIPRSARTTSHVTFTFEADADREYAVWVRGKMLPNPSPIEHDAVIFEIPGALVSDRPGPNQLLDGSTERGLINGFMHRKGYWWIGGDADAGTDAQDPVRVRFFRGGTHTLRLYPYETPVRIDAIWITTTRLTRPPDDMIK